MAYKDDKPVSITKVVIATQHDDMLNKFENQNAEHEFVEKEIIKHVIKPVLDECGLPYDESFIVSFRSIYGTVYCKELCCCWIGNKM